MARLAMYFATWQMLSSIPIHFSPTTLASRYPTHITPPELYRYGMDFHPILYVTSDTSNAFQTLQNCSMPPSQLSSIWTPKVIKIYY